VFPVIPCLNHVWHARYFLTFFHDISESSIMKQILSRTERILRAALGLIIVAVGVYALTFNLLSGLIVLGVGIFTLYESLANWTLIYALTESWVRPEGGGL
jgi:membrane-bound ClpP family serine protease